MERVRLMAPGTPDGSVHTIAKVVEEAIVQTSAFPPLCQFEITIELRAAQALPTGRRSRKTPH